MTRFVCGLLVLAVAVLLAGCATPTLPPATASPTPSITPSPTPTSTHTPLPPAATAPPPPSDTPFPTIVPVPVAEMLEPGDMIGDMVITKNRSLATEIWNYCDSVVEHTGVTAKRCDVPLAKTLFIGYGIAAETKEALDALWVEADWTLELDGQRVNLEAFGDYEQEIGGEKPMVVRMHNVALHPPTPGVHTLRYVYSSAGGMFDMNWTFTVVVEQIYPALAAEGAIPGQQPYTSPTAGLSYLLYVPEAYDAAAGAWPLLVYLHGSGERGSDLERLKAQPLPETLEELPDFPFIVVAPQMPAELDSWAGLTHSLAALIDEVEANLAVDPDRVYLTGLSMGGAGVWQLALAYPERFAALVPIAGYPQLYGGVIPATLCDLKELPVWTFQGAMDSAVAQQGAVRIAQAFQACGGEITYTVYEDAGHEQTWRRAYADPALLEWLAAQARD